MKGWNSMAMKRQAHPFSVLDAVATGSSLLTHSKTTNSSGCRE